VLSDRRPIGIPALSAVDLEGSPECVSAAGLAWSSGAIWGAIFGFVVHSATRRQRDFASTSAIVAARYEVTVHDAYAERARQLLSSLG